MMKAKESKDKFNCPSIFVWLSKASSITYVLSDKTKNQLKLACGSKQRPNASFSSCQIQGDHKNMKRFSDEFHHFYSRGLLYYVSHLWVV
jgi:hypothetical protein